MLKPWFARICMIASVGLWATYSHAQITNDITVSGAFGSTSVDAMDNESVAVVTAAPAVQLTKTVDEVQDTNGSGRVDAGDTVVYRFEVLNTGNLTLNQVILSDPMVNFSTSTLGPLLPTQSDATLTATYVLQQEDVDLGGVENSADAEGIPPPKITGEPQESTTDVSDAGDELVETAALDGTTDGDPTNDPTVLELEQFVELDVDKSLVALSQPFPFVFDLTYQIAVENLGNVTATDLVLTDDIVTQFAPGLVMAATVINPGGVFVAADLNPDFDGGENDASLLTAGLSLAPAETFSVDITVRVEVPPSVFVDGVSTLQNTATLDLSESEDPIPSQVDDVVGPVVSDLLDADLDGVVDAEETLTVDRDGDGTEDPADYDPTGYFYCEEDGAILPGGLVSVANLDGSMDAVRIVQDGSNGFFQWYVVEAGTYQMTVTPPTDGATSVDRLPAGVLVGSTLSGDYVSLGSNEDGINGALVDFSFGANPYHLTFEIAEGDPHILNNNIPFRHCGTPELIVEKTVIDGPTLLTDGRIALSYGIALESVGNSRAADIGISDPLDTVFGAGLFEVASLDITNAPASFTAAVNADYDGSSDTELLTAGGYLDPGETLEIELSLIVNPPESGVYQNIVTVTGADVIGGSQLSDRQDSADVLLTFIDLQDELLVSKSASATSVRVGDVVTYTIEVENNAAFGLSGLSLIDNLPVGIQYRAGTAEIDGMADEPTRSVRQLEWDNFAINSGQTRVLTLDTIVGSQAGPGDIVNEAWIKNPATGERVTRIATATIRVALEPIFDCSSVIGKVFEDRNLNGYQDPPPDLRAQITDQTYYGDKADRETLVQQQTEGEPGIANVRILTPTGTLITTDEFGRFSVPCAALPTESGTNFSLKVDERSLPTGFQIVTENPRTMRLTAGIFAEMNFGAALGNVIEIKLTAEAFDASGRPVAGLRSSLDQLRAQVGDTHTIVNLGYYYRSEGAAEARRRLDAVESMFEQAWRGAGRNSLTIQRSIFDAR